MLIVHPDYRRQKIATELYEYAERALTERGVAKIQLGGDVGHLVCGVPLAEQAGVGSLAQAKGFEGQLVESVDFIKMLQPLLHYLLKNKLSLCF